MMHSHSSKKRGEFRNILLIDKTATHAKLGWNLINGRHFRFHRCRLGSGHKYRRALMETGEAFA
jgi:hypothetical protein